MINPRISGFEDYDYTSEVIRRVSASDNAGDVFFTGLSKGALPPVPAARRRAAKSPHK